MDKTRHWIWAGAFASALVVHGGAVAADEGSSWQPQVAMHKSSTTRPDRSPVAIAALEKMGQTLRGLPTFRVDSEASLEVVLDSGRKVEVDTEVAYRVKQPNRMVVVAKDGRKDRELFYDGKQLTVWSPQRNLYATVPQVKPNLAELFTTAARDYGIELPLADLFYWGTKYAPMSSVDQAYDLGPMTMDGDRVHQYLYSQDGLDWQLWISEATSLPHKVVITDRGDPTQPEFSARLHWDTRTPIDEAAFRFVPPAGANAIELVPVAAAKASSTGGKKKEKKK